MAASEFFENGVYTWEGGARSAEEMTAIYEGWIADFPIVSIEDPLAEDDWTGWSALMGRIGDRVQVVGDDLFVTNVTRLQRGIDEKAASALLVKVNQIGSLTETLDAVSLAHRSGFACMMSHRSGRDRGHHHRRPRRGHQLRPDQVRALRRVRTGWPSTTSCCGSRRTSTTPPATPAPRPSRGSRPDPCRRVRVRRPVPVPDRDGGGRASDRSTKRAPGGARDGKRAGGRHRRRDAYRRAGGPAA